MFEVRLRKIWRDFWGNKPRTMLTVLSMIVGVLALSTTLRTYVVVSSQIQANYAAINPSSAMLVTDGFDRAMVEAVRKMPSIAAAEGLQRAQVRVQGDDGASLLLNIVAMDTFATMTVDRIAPETGAWPPPRNGLVLERSSAAANGIKVGDLLPIETSAGRQRMLPVQGLVHDITVFPGEIASVSIYGYTTHATLERLGLGQTLNWLRIVVAEDRSDRRHIQQVAQEVKERLEDHGTTVFSIRVPQPGEHQLTPMVRSVILLFITLAVLSLILSVFLMVNTIDAMLKRETLVIGVLKAVGAPERDVVGLYLVTVLFFALPTVLVALQLGNLFAHGLLAYISYMLNIDIEDFAIPFWVVAVEWLIGLLVPLLVALWPILHSTRISVREAIGAIGTQGVQFGNRWFDQWVSQMAYGSATLRYALRNMFRNQRRLVLTLIALSFGGAIFISILSVRASLFHMLDEAAAYWQEDITIDLYRPHRLEQVQAALAAVPGVTAIQGIAVESAVRVRPDGTWSNQELTLLGVPVPSQFLEPTLLEGRWLRPDDHRAMVLNVHLRAEEPDVDIGDTMVLRVKGQEHAWQVVGIATSQIVAPGALSFRHPIGYTRLKDFGQTVGRTNGVARLTLGTTTHTPAAQQAIAASIEQHLADRGFSILNQQTNGRMRAHTESIAMALIMLLLLMSLFFAVVGGFSLLGAMSLNVLERTREIGVLRSMGAAPRMVIQIIVSEGVFIGLLSGCMATLIAYPVGMALSRALGLSLFGTPLTYQFSFTGVGLWLVIVLLISAFASYVPAANALQRQVREALSYE